MIVITANPTFQMSLRADHNTSATRIGLLEYGQNASGDEIYTVPETGALYKAGDKWLHITEMAGKPVNGWMAVVHMGVEYCKILSSGETVPAPEGDVKKIIKAVVTYQTAAGLLETVDLYPDVPDPDNTIS